MLTRAHSMRRLARATTARALQRAGARGIHSSGSTAVDSRLVTLERQGRVGILRLNDPSRMNQMSVAMGAAIQEKVAEINANPRDFGAIVLTGEGGVFSACGDANLLDQRLCDSPTTNGTLMRELAERCLSLRSLPVPLIAAINGQATAAGLCLTLFADIRIVARDTKMIFVHHGLHPGMASSHFLPLIVGADAASFLMTDGKTINGMEAMKLGLVSKVVPSDDKVMAEAIKVANEMAAPSSTALRGFLRNLRFRQDHGIDLALAREADHQARTLCVAQGNAATPLAHVSECP